MPMIAVVVDTPYHVLIEGNCRIGPRAVPLPHGN